MIKTKEEVNIFLSEVRKRLEKSSQNLVIVRRTKSEDKTFNFISTFSIDSKLVCEELLKLDVSNYCYTDFDDKAKWSNEEVWIFGQIFFKREFRSYKEVYIKLKLRNEVICISFHPKERDLNYPYN